MSTFQFLGLNYFLELKNLILELGTTNYTYIYKMLTNRKPQDFKTYDFISFYDLIIKLSAISKIFIFKTFPKSIC